MLAKRLIPFFLLKNQRLVKGTRFKDHIDVGDPLSQALIYDAQGAEELVIVDIDATREKRLIDLTIVNRMATKCRLPISVGGGIKTVADARACFQSGADKIILNTAAVEKPQLIKKFVDEFGSANVVIAIDVSGRNNHKYQVVTHSGTQKTLRDPFALVKQCVKFGAGEIIVTSIHQEGTLSGFDCELYRKMRKIVPVPLIASGGAGCYDDLVHIFQDIECDAAAIGKMLFLRDYDIVRIKSYLKGRNIFVREA